MKGKARFSFQLFQLFQAFWTDRKSGAMLPDMNATTNIDSGAANIAAAARPAAKPTTTPGWQTSEFWMTALGQVGFLLAAVGGFLPPQYAAIAAAASQVAYSISRGMTKSAAA